ncbi:MAG: hypothetical protein P8R04_01160, partial [Gammaproteobacteria bacterium]|nr:hypothetical protein [Gammaproteobacteria bacterium]
NSARYIRHNQWADVLHSQALSVRSPVDLAECLEAFRNHDEFYFKRLLGISSWYEIPPLQKTELSAVPVSGAESLYESRSSGTTGQQAVVRNTVAERRFRQALAYRPFLFYPISVESDGVVRQLVFVDGLDVDPCDKEQWPYEFGGRWYMTWRVGIAAAPEKIYALIKNVRPQVLRGLTSGIVRFVEELQRPLEGFGVEIVSPSGETLLDEWRMSLSQAFAVPVLDRYGSTETGSLAWQCPYCDEYHINNDEVIVEDSAEGVLATPLFIDSQPLLRYRLNDKVRIVEEANDCRVRLPTIVLLETRRDDWVIDGSGMKVSPLSFQFESIAGLKSWQLHQLDTGELRLYFTADGTAVDVQKQLGKELQKIVSGRNYVLHAGIWQLQRAGKFKRVVSDLV